MCTNWLFPTRTNPVTRNRVNAEAKFVVKLVFLQRYIPTIPSKEGLCVLWHVHAEEVRLTCREMGTNLRKITFRYDCISQKYWLQIATQTTHVLYLQNITLKMPSQFLLRNFKITCSNSTSFNKSATFVCCTADIACKEATSESSLIER